MLVELLPEAPNGRHATARDGGLVHGKVGTELVTHAINVGVSYSF